MRKLIIAGIVCLSMLMSRQAFAVSSAAYGLTTVTDGNTWTSCFPKCVPATGQVGGAMTTTGVWFSSSSSGINGYSTGPVNIYTFPWLFMAGADLSGTSYVTGALTFSAGSSITSTIQRTIYGKMSNLNPYSQDYNILPVTLLNTSEAEDTTFVKDGSYWPASTSCGITEAISQWQTSIFFTTTGILGQVIYKIPSFCTPTVGNWDIHDYNTLTGQNNGGTFIYPAAPMYSLISETTGTGNTHIGHFNIDDFYSNVTGVGISVNGGLGTNDIHDIRLYRGFPTTIANIYIVDWYGEIKNIYLEDTLPHSGYDMVLDVFGENVSNIGVCNLWVMGGNQGGNTFNNIFSLTADSLNGLCVFTTDTSNSTFSNIGSGFNYIIVTGSHNSFNNVFNTAGVGDNITDTAGNNIYQNIYTLNNTSSNPDYVIGYHDVLTGEVLCLDEMGDYPTFGFRDCGTIPVGIQFISHALGGTWFTGGITADSITTSVGVFGTSQTTSSLGIYDNATGLLNMSHTINYDQQTLVNGCATVTLRYPFIANQYNCTFNYTSWATSIGIPAFTFTTNNFTVCSRSSIGVINTTDANTFTGTCAGD